MGGQTDGQTLEQSSEAQPSTVLAVSNCVGHDDTSYAVLKHVEVESEVATFGEAAKREQQGDNLTGKQNSSMTLGSKSRSGLPHSLLLKVIPAVFSRSCGR